MDKLATTESVSDLIDQQSRDYARQLFLFDPDGNYSLSFQQLQQQASAVAAYIASQGVARGQSVAYAFTNGPCCAAVVLGIMYGGYRAVAINLVAGRDVIAYVLSHSQTVLVLTQDDVSALISSALHSDAFVQQGAIEPPIVSIEYTSVLDWASEPGKGLPGAASAGDDALLMYTSGTTGRPKGVTLSHANVIAGGRNVAMGHKLERRDRALCVLPLYHINGLCVTLLGPLVSGGSLVLPARFSTSVFWQLIDNHQCSWFSVVPTQIAYLLRDATSDTTAETTANTTNTSAARAHVRFGRSASAPLSPDVHAAFEKRFGMPVIETMGLTETAAQILTNPLPPLVRKLGSPGVPVGDEVIIADAQLQPVLAGVEGEVLVRGPNVMQRYFRNAQATSEALVNDGWLRTGDLGRKDEQGYVFITGRLKELIIKGGENIAPREIDDALYQHPDVVEAAAFACVCENFGQRVEAAVVLKVSSALQEADLIAACEHRVGKFKCPDTIHFLRELPKGPSGKIQRVKIADAIRAAQTSAAQTSESQTSESQKTS